MAKQVNIKLDGKVVATAEETVIKSRLEQSVLTYREISEESNELKTCLFIEVYAYGYPGLEVKVNMSNSVYRDKQLLEGFLSEIKEQYIKNMMSGSLHT